MSPDYLQAVIALGIVVGLLLLLPYGLRALNLAPAQPKPGGKKQLSLVESLSLDTKTRTVVLRHGDTNYIVLLSQQGPLLLERQSCSASSDS